MNDIFNPEEIKSSDPILAAVAEQVNQTIPSAYIPVRLSTQGFLGAPEVFHTKNFSTGSLLELSLADDPDLPKLVCEKLDELIFEDITVKDFHEQEVIEYLLFMYKTFFTSVLKDLEFQVTDEDKEFLANNFGGVEAEEYKNRIRSLDNKTWVPRFDVNLEALKTYPVNKDFKSTVQVTKKNGFCVKYSFPRYGDVVTLKNYLDAMFKERDKQFANIIETYKFSRDAKERYLKGENLSLQSLPKVPEAELKKAREYEAEKALFLVKATQALHLIEYKGQDVSNLTLDKRMELINDPDLDYITFKKVSDYFGELKVGLEKEIEVYNPIQNKNMLRGYSFRLADIFSAIQRGESDGVDFSFV